MKYITIVVCWYLGCFSDFFGVYIPTLAALNTHSTRNSHNICPPITIPNGLAKRRARGRIVRFFCVRGFLLAGEKTSTCTRGRWDPVIPRCVRPTCKPLSQQNLNGNLLIYPTHSGAVQHFFCKAGNQLNGPRDIYCNGSRWSDNVPTCLPANEKPKLSCDFESPDICGWTHDPNHDFDWRRENYNTPSGLIGTGPSFDHTKGKGKDGYYMYIESSSKAENDSARLISPVYDLNGDDICFKFYYHMFGSTIGTLRVYLKQINESWDLNPNSAFFSKSKNQGDKWYSSLHHLGNIKNQFQIIIEGVRGNGYVSDIAIDDVEIIEDCQNLDDYTTTEESSTYNEESLIIDTCDNRCGQKENITELYHLTCDCDDDCFRSDRCCPDYYDTCLDNTSPDDLDATVTEDEFTETNYVKKTTTYKPPSTTTTKRITTTTIRPTIKSYSTRTTYPVTTRTSLKTTTRYKPIIYLKTPRPTLPIYRRTTTSTPKYTSTTQRRVVTVPVRITRPKITVVTPVKTASTKKPSTTPVTTVTANPDDVRDVPRPTNIDEAVYDVIGASKEFWSDEIENNIDSPYTGNFSESNKLFSQVAEEKRSPHVVTVVIGICAAVIVIAVAGFVVVRRYRFSRRSLQSSNGESQSDVRFLANSDVLDLSLADVYDELLN